MIRTLSKTLVVVAASLALALPSTGAYASGPDITAHPIPGEADAGHATFKTSGDHLYIGDDKTDGHSVVAIVEQGSRRYYWNHDGNGTTRHVDLDLPENVTMALVVCLGDWEGTPTGGIRWDTCGTAKQTES